MTLLQGGEQKRGMLAKCLQAKTK